MSPRCIAVDLATGVWGAALPPREEPRTPAAPQGWHVVQSPQRVALCKDTACKDLPVPALADGQYMTAVHPDGTYVVLGDQSIGVWFLDGSGAKLAEHELTESGGCMHQVDSAGAHVFVAVDVCAGPGAEGALYDWRGKLVAAIEGINPYQASAIPLGDQFYIADVGGDAIAFVHGKTGKIRVVDVPCESCPSIDAMPFAGHQAITARGRLVNANRHLIAVIDPRTHAITSQFKYPICR